MEKTRISKEYSLNILFIFFLILSSAHKACATHSTYDKFSKGYFLIHSTGRFKFDLKRIINKKESVFILFTSEKGLKSLKKEEKEAFSLILSEKAITFLTLRNNYEKAHRLLPKLSLPSLNIITHDEYSMALAAKLRDYYGMEPSYNVISKFTDKFIMKESLSNTEIKIPKYIRFDQNHYLYDTNYLRSIIDYLGLPIFAKKIMGTCSEGSQKINSLPELKRWAQNKKTQEEYELDEFLDGTVFHCDSLISDGKIIFTLVSRYASPPHLYQKGEPLGSILLPMSAEITKRLVAYNEEVLKSLKETPNGMTHLEVFRRPNNELFFLEIAARSAGAAVPEAYEVFLRDNIQELHYRSQMGLPIQLNQEKGPYSAWVWFPITKEGPIAKFNIPLIKSKYTLKWHYKQGELLSKKDITKDRIGEIILYNESHQQLEKDFHYL